MVLIKNKNGILANNIRLFLDKNGKDYIKSIEMMFKFTLYQGTMMLAQKKIMFIEIFLTKKLENIRILNFQ